MQARVKHSIIGKLTKGTNYATMAIDNTSRGLTNKTFIKRKSKTSELVCILIVKGRSLGVWDFVNETGKNVAGFKNLAKGTEASARLREEWKQYSPEKFEEYCKKISNTLKRNQS